jgi:hypothetical protein
MGNEYTFYDYIDASGGSNNVINAWLNGQGKMAKAYFNHVIPNLEGSPPPGFKDTYTHWRSPGTALWSFARQGVSSID